MPICCPGPPALSLAWIPCGADEPLEAIEGYTSLVTRTRGDRCPIARLTWATQDWTHDSHPTVGDRVTVGNSSYFVDSSVYFGCTVTLALCRPVLECPDCTSTIYRLSRTDDACVDPLVADVVDSAIPTQVCITDRQRRVIDNVEVHLVQARICLDSIAQVEPGDLVVCGIDVWRVERIESPCSSTCLLTVFAIREPFGIYDSLIPPQPDTYRDEQVNVVLPTVDITALGSILSPAQDYDAIAVLTLPAIEVGAVGTFQGNFVGSADLGLPTANVAAVGTAPPANIVDGALLLPTANVAAVGKFIEQLVGTADFGLPTANVAGVGDADLPPIEYQGSADLDMPTANVAAVGFYVDQYHGTADLSLPPAQVAAVGQSKVNVTYEGTATECPPWDTFDGNQIETFDAQQIELEHHCGLTLPTAHVAGVGIIAWGYIGSADFGLPTAHVAAVGQSVVSEEYEGTADLDMPTASITAVGLYTLESQFLGRAGGCGPWVTDLDEIITDDFGNEIVFGEDCALVLPGVQFTASGTFNVDSAAGTASLDLPCVDTQGFVEVAPPPVQQFDGTATFDISAVRIDATGGNEPPPTANYDGTAVLDISGIEMNVDAMFEAPPAQIVGMTGGFYILTGASPQVQYPLTDEAYFRWGFTSADDMEGLFLTLPLDIAQGADVTSAILKCDIEALGDPSPLHGTITAWDTDHAPETDPNFSPDQVRNLPRTTAEVDVSFPMTPSLYEQDIDVTEIVKEIVARPGWQPGSRIMFILEENGGTPAGSHFVTFEMGLTQPEFSTHLVVEVGGFVDVPWTRANYWYFEGIESGCTQGSANPILHAAASEMILRTQTDCGPSVVRRWGMGIAVIGLDEIVNEAQLRLDTNNLLAGSLPYNTTSVTAYYELSAFTETSITNGINRANLKPTGGVVIPWHWSYGETGYVIGGFGPLLQAMQSDPAYTLGQNFRLVIVPNDSANWDNNPSAPIQGHRIDTQTPILEYTKATNAETPLASPAWLMEAEDYPDAKMGLAYDSTNYQTILNESNPITVSTSSALQTAVSQARSDSTIKAIYLNPGSYNWPTNLLSGSGGIHRTASEPLVIRTTPGAASQALLIGQDTNSAILEQGTMHGIAFVDLDLSNSLRLLGQGGMGDLLVERCYGSVEAQGGRQQGQTIPGTTLVLPGQIISNVVIRLNVLADHWRPDGGLYHGFYGYHIETLLFEGNYVDHNGWSDSVGRDVPDNQGGASTHKHNIYINPAYPLESCRNYVIRYNIISRGSSHGIQGKVGHNCYRNLFIKNPIACHQGFGGDQQYTGYGVRQDPVFRDNVCVAAADIDSGNPRGVGLWTTCVDNLLFENNLFLDNGTSNTSNETYWLERDFPIEISMIGNRSVNWPSQLPNRGANNFTPVILVNTGNVYSGLTLTPTAQALADTVKSDAYLNALKVNRRRIGVDIEELKQMLSTLQGGVS